MDFRETALLTFFRIYNMKLEFVRLTLSDVEEVRQWRNSAFVSKYMYSDEYISEEQQLNWFNKISRDISCCYWIVKQGEEKVGLASISNIDKKNKRCFWAFYLKGEEYAGSGVGAVTEYFIIKYAFEELSLNKITCEVFSFNEKVIGLHEKFGFKREGFLRQHIFKNDKFEDVVVMGLLESDWQLLKLKYETIFKNKIA